MIKVDRSLHDDSLHRVFHHESVHKSAVVQIRQGLDGRRTGQAFHMPIVYIRVLKYDAQWSPVKSALDITLALTLTTDLGDASHPHSTPLECQLSTRLGKETVRLEWSGTRAVQKYRFEIAYDSVFGKSLDRTYQVSISALDTPVTDQTEGGTVGVGRSPQFLTKFIGSPCLTSGRLVVPLSFTQTLEIPFEKSIERRFTVDGCQVSFIEETQESIVSHSTSARLDFPLLVEVVNLQKPRADMR